MNEQTWSEFHALNAHRRAVRDFDGREVPEADVRAVLAEAMLAPSSGNLQPYQLHWVRSAALRGALAEACAGQRAARTAGALVVVVARPELASATLRAFEAQLDDAVDLPAPSLAWHRAESEKFAGFLRWAPLLALGSVRVLLSALFPAYSLLPLGRAGLRQWAARSSVYAAQTLLLAASARGLDSCPMEGFDARKLARLLGLPRGSVVPVVVALGYRAADARVEARWRRPACAVVVEHA
jgi:nitroreductase